MGQKTNAISLRLNINRNFDSCWFEDKSFEYSKLLQQDLKIRKYIQSLFQFVGIHTGRISIQIFPKKLVIHYYLHDMVRSSNTDASKSDRRSMQGNKKNQISSRGLTSSILAGPKALGNSTLENLSEVQSSPHLESSKIQNVKNRSIIIPFQSNSFDFAKSRLIGKKINSKMEDLSESFRMQYFQFLTKENFQKNINTKDFQSGEVNPSIQELKKRFFIKYFLASFYFSQNKNLFQIQNFLKFSHYFLESELFSKMLLKDTRILTKQSLAAHKVNNSTSISGLIRKANSTFYESETFNVLENYKLKREEFLLDMNLKHIEFILRKNFQSNTIIIPKKIYNKYKSAQFVCEYVSQRIQQNIPFRQIYKQLVLEMKKFDEIQGMRIVCSGRLGGVEMATVESRKYGQTSLHVFSSKIDFATGQAYTLFGLIGIKVWICFR